MIVEFCEEMIASTQNTKEDVDQKKGISKPAGWQAGSHFYEPKF